MTFGETPNPRKNVPKAVKQTFWRIACFYILGVLVLGMAIPYDNETLIGATQQATSGGEQQFRLEVVPLLTFPLCSRLSLCRVR